MSLATVRPRCRSAVVTIEVVGTSSTPMSWCSCRCVRGVCSRWGRAGGAGQGQSPLAASGRRDRTWRTPRSSGARSRRGDWVTPCRSIRTTHQLVRAVLRPRHPSGIAVRTPLLRRDGIRGRLGARWKRRRHTGSAVRPTRGAERREHRRVLAMPRRSDDPHRVACDVSPLALAARLPTMHGRSYVVVSGPPASGKSTLASELARCLRLPLVSKDTIKEALMTTLTVERMEESQQLGRAAIAVMFALAAASPTGAVLDSVFLRGCALDDLRALPGHIVEVFCRCDREVARARYRARASRRLAGHLDDERSDDDIWNDENAQPIAGPWPVIEVNTNTRFGDVETLTRTIRRLSRA